MGIARYIVTTNLVKYLHAVLSCAGEAKPDIKLDHMDWIEGCLAKAFPPTSAGW
jgi:hypothetical protein